MDNISLVYIEGALKNIVSMFRGYSLKLYLKYHKCTVGRKLKCQSWPWFRAIPFKNISIGDRVTIGPRVTFEVLESGNLKIGDNVHLTQDILISCHESIEIGARVGIAEYVSLRDSDHGLAKDINPHYQQSITGKIVIKNDSGIGRGAAIFRDVTIEEGVIIGANCMIMRGTRTLPYGIYLGNPARLIGKRH